MAKTEEREKPILVPSQEWAARRSGSRRFKWVELNDARVCVWQSSAGDSLKISRMAMNPLEEGAIDQVQGMIWSIIQGCYNAEPPDGERVFNDAMGWAVQSLFNEELSALLSAIAEVNGTDAQTLEAIQNFTGRPMEN